MRLRVNKQRSRVCLTFMELVLVTFTLGILAVISTSYYLKVVVKTKVSKAKLSLDTVARAESIYKLSNGAYITVDADEAEVTVGTLKTSVDLNAVDADTDFEYSVTGAGVVSASNTAAIGSCAAGTTITLDIPTRDITVPPCYK